MSFTHKIVWLTDLHITESGQVENTACAARLAQAVEQINRWHGDADCCVITGDLTDTGAPGEYTALIKGLAPLAIPALPMIGNHDNRPALRAAMPPAGTAMEAYHQFRHDIGPVTLLCLDTHLPGSDAGALDQARLDWIAEQLAATAGRQVLVFMHHPPGPLGLSLLDDMPLQDSGPLIDLLAAAPQVAHVFCGHVHRPVSGTVGGVPFTTLRALAHQTRPPHHLKTWSDFVVPEERPQYGVILVAPDRVVMQAIDLERPA